MWCGDWTGDIQGLDPLRFAMKTKRVGYWFTDVKSKKLKFEEFVDFCRCSVQEFELVQIDLNLPIHEQGPFDAIIHKFNELVLEVDQGDTKSQVQLQHVQEYLKNHPEVIQIDPFDISRKLLNRYENCRMIAECEMFKGDSNVFIPNFAVITSQDTEVCLKTLQENNVHFPLVSKPICSEIHEMALIFDAEGLKDVPSPYLAQSFINHSATLYKLYIIGDELFFVTRPSLKNFTPETDKKTVFFHTFEVSKEQSSIYLTQMNPSEQMEHQPRESYLKKIADSIRATLNMDLIGVDVIIEDETMRYAVIDVNVFPGYKGIAEFFPVLRDFILKKINASTCTENKMLAASKSGLLATAVDTNIPVNHITGCQAI